MTLAGSLSVLLSANWTLTGDLATSKIHFDVGWYDKTYIDKPQVVVSELSNPVGKFFGSLNAVIHHRYVVNCWHRIPVGAEGATEYGYVENMRQEVYRIINNNRHGINSFDIIVPQDEGTARHELDNTPRILRYELVVFGARSRT